jgi:hypothetical protein
LRILTIFPKIEPEEDGYANDDYGDTEEYSVLRKLIDRL